MVRPGAIENLDMKYGTVVGQAAIENI